MKDDIFKNDDSLHLSEDEINSPEFDPEDFAPAPENVDDGSANCGNGRRNSMIFAVIAAVFTLILAIVGVFGLGGTDDAGDPVRAHKVLSCFENCSSTRYYNNVDGCDVYAVLFRDKLAGYGIFKTVRGWAGDIEVLVCFDSDNIITKVCIISENESDSLGDKIRKNSFLSAFEGMSQADVSDMSVDLISGATVSSTAVENAVKDVLKLGVTAFDMSRDMRLETISSAQIDEEIDKQPEDTTGRADTEDEMTAPDTGKHDSPNLDGEEGGNHNYNTGGGDIDVGVSDVTTVYESEGETEPDTDTTVPPDTTDAPPVTQPPVTTAPPQTSDEPVTSEEPVSSDTETDPEDTEDTGTGEPDDSREPVDNSQGGMN